MQVLSPLQGRALLRSLIGLARCLGRYHGPASSISAHTLALLAGLLSVLTEASQHMKSIRASLLALDYTGN